MTGLTPTLVARSYANLLAVAHDTLNSEFGPGCQVLACGLVMMATGRAPRTSGLGLEAAGVAVGKHGEVLVGGGLVIVCNLGIDSSIWYITLCDSDLGGEVLVGDGPVICRYYCQVLLLSFHIVYFGRGGSG